MMDKVRIGVIGLGAIAQVIHLPILSKLKEVELVGLCDVDKPKARYLAERYGVKTYHSDPAEMLKSVELDAVDVCTPTNSHRDMALLAIECGADALVEKPIARNYKEAVEIAEAARSNKRKVMVGMNNRFRPDSMVLKSFMENGELGKIFYVKTGWLRKQSVTSPWFLRKEHSGGGVFLDLGIAAMDLALWLAGYPEVKRVSAANYSLMAKNVEDTCTVFLTMNDEMTVLIEASWSLQTESDFFYCDLFGTEGSARVNPLRINKQMHGSLVNVTPIKTETAQNMYKRSYESELKHFVGAVRGLHPVISTADDAVKRMKIVDAIYKSAEKRKEVTLS
ncbi:MAG: Gfo/Idh/MocA family oxidoreductase [Bacteroidota bacterium]